MVVLEAMAAAVFRDRHASEGTPEERSIMASKRTARRPRNPGTRCREQIEALVTGQRRLGNRWREAAATTSTGNSSAIRRMSRNTAETVIAGFWWRPK